MAPGSRFTGERVRLVGLSNAALCGAEGVGGPLDAATGRVCVQLTAPEAAVAAHPAGVKARARRAQLRDRLSHRTRLTRA